jgi:hypothetical protein
VRRIDAFRELRFAEVVMQLVVDPAAAMVVLFGGVVVL